MSKTMFEKIKKRNGEAFAKAISAYDNGIFDIPNIDKIVYYAGRQAEPIMNYLISLKNIKIKENQTQETPMELLKKKGYNAYYADTLQKQNAIRKYFAPGEGLCTFGDAHRFEKFYIVNAVKENVDEIKRKDFSVPCREDEYGRSVISIQILKTGGFISIKNRYNHAVENSDNTFGSDPDEIIDGLAQSLRNYFHVDFSSKQCFLPNGYVSFNGMILKYHTESNNFYFGEDGYMYKGNFYPINKDYEMIIENMIFNLKDKTITFPDHSAECTGSILESEIKNKKLQVVKGNQRCQKILADGQTLLEVVGGRLRSVFLPMVQTIGNHFLSQARKLENFVAPNLRSVGCNFLFENKGIKNLSLPKLKTVGDDFLALNQKLESLEAPTLRYVGENFLLSNRALKSLSLPSLCFASSSFLEENEILEHLYLPNISEVGERFLMSNEALTSLRFPKLTHAGECFLFNNGILSDFQAEELTIVGDSFLASNSKIKYIYLPKLAYLGSAFFCANSVFEAYLPCLKNEFLEENVTNAIIRFSHHKNNEPQSQNNSGLINQKQRD